MATLRIYNGHITNCKKYMGKNCKVFAFTKKQAVELIQKATERRYSIAELNDFFQDITKEVGVGSQKTHAIFIENIKYV